jgi:hypothetical protein
MAFREDNEFQRKMRDAVLKPSFYERFYKGRYEFLDPADPRAAGGIDTIITRRDGSLLRIDEKIVRWPVDKISRLPRERGYDAIALETMSNINQRYEKDGWMVTSGMDALFYCLTSLDEARLDAYMIKFPELKAWFWPRQMDWHLTWTENQLNTSECRVVPLRDIMEAVPVKRWTVVRPPFFDEFGTFIHYCHCGAWGSFGHGVSMRRSEFGTWHCAEHPP